MRFQSRHGSMGMVNLWRTSPIHREHTGLPLCSLLVVWYMRVKEIPGNWLSAVQLTMPHSAA